MVSLAGADTASAGRQPSPPGLLSEANPRPIGAPAFKQESSDLAPCLVQPGKVDRAGCKSALNLDTYRYDRKQLNERIDL